MSLDTATPKGMLIAIYNRLSQILIAPAGSEAIQCNFRGDAGGQPDRATGRSHLPSPSSSPYGGAADPTQERANIDWVMRA
jgi:hypothetical protein